MINLKRCSKCKLEKPITEFGVHSKAHDGFYNQCKPCKTLAQKLKREENPERVKARKAEYYLRHKEEIREKQSLYYQENAESIKKKTGKYYRKNIDKVKTYIQSNADIISQKRRKYRAKHIDRIRTYSRFYYQTHKQESNERNKQKFHLKRRNGGHHTPKEWRLLKAVFKHTCLACGKKEPEIKLTKDHIIPIMKGGTDDIGNLQPLCLLCNMSKKDKVVDFRVTQ